MNREQPRVSVGMPVYNGEPYLKEALNSLLAQTFSDFELTKANTTDAALVTWFDPQNQGKILLPHWRHYLEHYRTISNAQIVWCERVFCYIKVVQLSLLSSDPKRWWRMTTESTKALKGIFQLSNLGQIVQISSTL